MEAFVITLREGVEAALIIALVISYLNRTGRQEMRPWVYAGLGLAVVASLLGAWIFSLIGLDPENELLEGILMAVAAVMVASLVIWMWRAAKGMKQQVEGRLESLTAPDNQKYGWGLLAFVFFMILREGIETVVFMAALSLTNTPDLVAIIGASLGLILAALVGWLFIRGSLRINLRVFFAVTGVVLLMLAVRLAAGSLHEFHEAGVLTLPHFLEEASELLVEGGTGNALLIAMVVLPLLSMLPGRWLRPAASQTSQ